MSRLNMQGLVKCRRCGGFPMMDACDSLDSNLTNLVSIECSHCDRETERFEVPSDSTFSKEMSELIEQLAMQHWNHINRRTA